MHKLKVLFLFIFLSLVFFSCENKEKPECITALDCLEGYVCVEEKCVDTSIGDGDIIANLPDDNITEDKDSIKIDEDTVIFPDPDIVDEDAVSITDHDYYDVDNIKDSDVYIDEDTDHVDSDIADADSDINDADNYEPVCGNAIPEGTEKCDLGVVLNNGAYGGCKSDCTLAIRCGDGIKNYVSELCDAGVNNGSYGFCKTDCSGLGERCGDGTLNGTEVCDDGANNASYGYCLYDCSGLGIRCGDGSKNGPFGVEECDKGADNGVVTACTYGLTSCKVCDSFCKELTGTVAYCGDNTKNGPEECDDGADNGKYGYCNSECSGINSCGDSTVQSPEICDKNTTTCNTIGGMGYNNAAVVDCNSGCNGWITADCTCSDGYEKDSTQKCVDTNECDDEILNTCHENADCNNTSGSFNCTCKTNYSGNGFNCTADTRVNQNCAGLPLNAVWNTATVINQTWSGTAWMPSTTGVHNTTSSTTECRFACNANYTWNGTSLSCVADTKPGQSCTGLPDNASWNTVSSINQTWSGTAWAPTTSGVHNTAASTTECRFKCNTNYTWNSGSSTCVADTRINQSCTGLIAYASWNTASSINQTWSGSDWTPATVGVYNTTSSTTECRFACNNNYTWNGTSSSCVADTKPNQSCTGIPLNASWNTASSITQTWNGSAWTPSTTGVHNTVLSTTECRFKCNSNYTWNSTSSSCVADTRSNQSCTGLPLNASWNTESVISQTWDGAIWVPTTAGVYNITPSSTECRFKCNTNYTWNSGSSTCVADIRYDQGCTGLPSNAVWNTASSINQTWSGSTWLPTTTGIYSTTPSTTECHYKCSADYHLEGESCVSNTRENQSCTGLISNASWNTASNITQTWTGSAWTPSTAGSYNTTSSTTECRYSCNATYHRDGASCVSDTRAGQACTGLISNADWNTVSSITQTWDGSGWTPATAGVYDTNGSTTECRYQCKVNYNRSGSACVAATQPATCSAKPSNTDWNDGGKNGTYTQTWNGSAWAPVTATTYNTSAGDCRYICSAGYHWETSVCVSNTRTNQTCSAKPANTDWNTVSSITQNWSGGVWTPTTTSSYNESGSTTNCYYKCLSGYHYESSSCILNTRTQSCTGLPSNAQWNTVSSITQTWDGSWSPSTEGTYNTTGSTTECRFQCSAGFAWNGLTCIGACPSNVSLATWNSGDEGWIKEGAWVRNNSRMEWGSGNSYNDDYTHNLTYNNNVDLSACSSATLTFTISLSDDISWDGETYEDRNQRLYVECSGDGGGSWMNMTPPTLPNEQTKDNTGGDEGCTTYYCDGDEYTDRSFSVTVQTWTVPVNCRAFTAKFRFRANGTSAWEIYNPGWTVDTVRVN